MNFFHNINYTMNGELLIVLFILLLAFILFSFLGRKSILETLVNSSTIYYGDNGLTATVTTDGSVSTINVSSPNGTPVTFTSTSSSNNSFTGPNGATATITTNNGIGTLTIVDAYGNTIAVFTTQSNTSSTNTVDVSNNNYNQYDNYNHYTQTSYPVIFYGPNGATARVIQTPNNNTIVITYKNGTTQIYHVGSQSNVQQYYGPNGGSAKMITTTNGQKAVEITMPNGQKIYYYTTNNMYNDTIDDTINQYTGSGSGSDYNNAFSTNSYFGGNVNTITGPAGNTVATYDNSAYSNGIPKYMIPKGQEDLYILKSEVVPPVCPKCPEPIIQCPDADGSTFNVTKCPPCPPCARCPEPSFDCKKVPNYNAFNPDTMPVPVLSDFSQFGM